MRDWLIGLAVALAVVVTSWTVLYLLARRLPPPRDSAKEAIR